ncbi:MAG: ferritin-like domain-containing protein [Gemmatimonadota bacterium]
MASRKYRHISRPPPPKAKKTSGDHALPPKPAEMSWRDYLVMLLHIAAEIEHGLMVEYLYSAYSLGGLKASKYDREVHRWRDTILTVAREEMGHLLTVQNVLCLIGGPVSFERDDYPWSTPFYPFPFELEPFSLKSIANYTFAEMPSGELEEKEDRIVKREVMRYIKDPDAHQVGEIYDRVLEVISDEAKIPDTMFEPETYKYQATFDDWGRGYRPGPRAPNAPPSEGPPPHERKTRVIVTRVATRTEAIAALKDVAGQGEAEYHRSGPKVEPSHFDRFAGIFRELKAITKQEGRGWSPARHVPTNPIADAPTHDGGASTSTSITAEPSRTWASLFNIRYRMLLTLLTYAYRVPRDAPEAVNVRRGPIMARVFSEMYNLKAIAGILVRLPLRTAKDPARAGPPFQMPYTLTPPYPESNFWRMQFDLLVTSEELTAELLHPTKKNLADAPRDGERYLTSLRDLDRNARTWIEQVLTGLSPSRRFGA